MLHPRFCLDEWLVRFPLTPRYAAPTYDAEIITSPIDICHNEQLRRVVEPFIDWGPEVPVDVFVWASGAPPEPYLTKLGGVPYRAANLDWPVDRHGSPMQFLAQLCFSDSKDLVGALPGDVLLAFVEEGDYEFERLQCEWQPLGLRDVLSPESMPRPFVEMDVCHGYLMRTYAYPQGKPREEFMGNWTTIVYKGWYYHRLHLLLQYQATQIGSAPFIVQKMAPYPGRIIATLSSVEPDQHSRFPWANRAEPLCQNANEWINDGKNLVIGDMGCIYFSIDDNGNVTASAQYY